MKMLLQDKDTWMSPHTPTFSAIDSYKLPDNVAILTLQVAILTLPV